LQQFGEFTHLFNRLIIMLINNHCQSGADIAGDDFGDLLVLLVTVFSTGWCQRTIKLPKLD